MKLCRITLFIIVCFLNSSCVQAQKIKLYNYSFAYRTFEMKTYGTNPLTAARYLKESFAYSNFINNFTYNEINGNPAIQNLKTFYFSTEWKIDDPTSKFWKKHTIQTGLLLTNKSDIETGALINRNFVNTPERLIYEDKFSLRKVEQFIGLQLGINKRYKLSNLLQFATGIYVQGSIPIVHKYTQQIDSSIIKPSISSQTKTTKLPDLAINNVFQWQAMVPIALELAIDNTGFSVRLEFLFGIVGSKFRQPNFAEREAHGFGFSILYKPKVKK